jgi:3-oxoacyl-[acyl-carrier-protein] synthase III
MLLVPFRSGALGGFAGRLFFGAFCHASLDMVSQHSGFKSRTVEEKGSFMVAFRYKNVCLESCAITVPPQVLTSAEIEDRLAEIYRDLGIPFGTLERLTGISARNFWDIKERPSALGTEVVRKAVDQAGFELSDMRALFSCSVTRDYFEPATGCIIHKNLEMSEDSIALDVSNACLGFMDGIFFLSNLIESGHVKAGVVVSAEHTRVIVENTFKSVLEGKSLSRDQLLRMLPTFTIGSGAVAYVLCHESISKHKRRIVGGATRSATQHCDLCVGNVDYHLVDGPPLGPVMETESSKLIAAAAVLGKQTWADASEVLGWSKQDVDHVFCHQVGRQVNEAFYNTLGLDHTKEFIIYPTRGNLVSAALPTAFAVGLEQKEIKKGEKIVLTGFGSGLNSLFLGIEW